MIKYFKKKSNAWQRHKEKRFECEDRLTCISVIDRVYAELEASYLKLFKMENMHKKLGLVKFVRIYRVSLKNLDWWLKRFNFGPLLTISDHYSQFRTIIDKFGSLLTISDHYWQFRTIIDNFGYHWCLMKISDRM